MQNFPFYGNQILATLFKISTDLKPESDPP